MNNAEYNIKIRRLMKDPKWVSEQAERLLEEHKQMLKRHEAHENLTEEQINYITENDCQTCGTQRCMGIESEWGTGCSALDKFIERKNNGN